MFSSHLALMRSLQFSDSFFPSGATAFSWGLESLNRDQIVTDADSLAHYIETQLLHRWVSFDQGILCAAWQTFAQSNSAPNNDLTALFEMDDLADAMTLSESIRNGSRKLGQTLSNVHIKLGTASAIAVKHYLIKKPETPHPHLVVIQGYLWASLGLGELEARAISAHGLCTSATSAALRLGLIGHIDAQRMLMRLHNHIVEALQSPAPAINDLSSSTLAVDIANLRHEALDARMFVN